MSHMPSSEQPSGATGTSSGIVITYTATGAEGTSFLVPIGQTLNGTSYEIVWSSNGVGSVPVLDLPDTDKSTTQFRVNLADVLTAGDKLVFVLFQV
jgi:hypothetical protein